MYSLLDWGSSRCVHAWYWIQGECQCNDAAMVNATMPLWSWCIYNIYGYAYMHDNCLAVMNVYALGMPLLSCYSHSPESHILHLLLPPPTPAPSPHSSLLSLSICLRTQLHLCLFYLYLFLLLSFLCVAVTGWQESIGLSPSRKQKTWLN